ncbi:protein-L-isoaspartate(D-aspartate) O-methyltransferase [Oricola cellulosilytica]|uniref:Protein-L-isoaspartate O-methyltransferase n=1 Tax=Oricola cellulosilytica TaxID=1429082 RepID=A0A4R0P6C3_9HYPH|nr:protein-L-isoaspartate(D-aspartate) O-methyltransferase [Oricola cellulosilytica]
MVSDADREGFAAFLLRMRTAGIDNKSLMSSIEAIPRRQFVEPQFHHVAMGSRTIPIGCGETLEGLDLQARILHELDLDAGQRVLEIGTGTGFTACVLSKLVKRVYTVERFKTLHGEAMHRMRHLGIGNIVSEHCDGAAGSSEGPFDRIVCWAAFETVPRAFVEQLVSGGRMVCPLGPADQPQNLVRMTKVGSRFEREDIGAVRFQPIEHGLPAFL